MCPFKSRWNAQEWDDYVNKVKAFKKECKYWTKNSLFALILDPSNLNYEFGLTTSRSLIEDTLYT